MKRLLTILALLCVALPVYAQKTPAPFVLQSYYNANGNPYDSAGMCVYVAGSSTLATSYTTAAGTVANANPLMMDSSGRPASNGFFLTPGSSYKLVLVDYTGVAVPSCSPVNGVTVWSQDDINATPGSAANTDVTGTAGESIAAGEVVYLSDGSGSKNAGQWYRADADLVYAGALPVVGLAPEAIVSGSVGTIRIQGLVTGLSALTTGADYYISTTVGTLTATPPPYARLVGRAQSATSLIVVSNPRSSPTAPRQPCGRLTLTTGVPVTVSDVTAATSMFYTPYDGCNSVSLYDGAQWAQRTFTEVSIAVPATTNTMYDVFAFDNAGTFTLELTAWTNDTTRATALVKQDGVYVKTGALTRLYLGSFRTTGVSGQTEDSFAKRYVWNYYHRAERLMRVLEATNSWNYTTASWRQANGATANQLDFVIGVAEVALNAQVVVLFDNNAGGNHAAVGIGLDSTTAPTTGNIGMHNYSTAAGTLTQTTALLRVFPAEGRHVAVWLENPITAAGVTSWYGDNGDPTIYQSGISGTIWG